MAKAKTLWYCSNCGNESPKWMGQCPACKEWNTMVEAPAVKGSGSSTRRANIGISSDSAPVPLKDVATNAENRISLGNNELDRLLGGGIVPGSLVLIGGEPGIGKSTLSLQIPLHSQGLKTLYVSGEESASQIKMRARRLGGDDSQCDIYAETLLDNVLREAQRLQPDLMIVDSVQTMYCENVESTAGSVSQVREVAARLLRFCKESGIPVILIGHITKDGTIAGPKILEHIVDVVLQFEGESRGAYRILRSIKNRFGSTSELAVYEMTGEGLREVANPSEMLIPMHEEGLSGAAICAMLEGNRPLFFEVQALVSQTAYGMAQRSATGFDIRRLNMLLAVLEKRGGLKLGTKDVFLNIAGGLRVSDPACDLAVVAAILSSGFDIALPESTCFAAEVGLSGEIRPVAQCDRLITEAARLGYRRIFISSYTSTEGKKPEGMEIVKIANIGTLLKTLVR